MSIVVFGLNHRSTPLRVLERMTVDDERRAKLARRITGSGSIAGTVVLSTCNRTEIYVDAERFHDSFEVVRDALSELGDISRSDVGDHLVSSFEAEAVEHLFRVAAGLDSAVLGEHEIVGQVRKAWEAARTDGSITPALDRLGRRAIEVAKKVRTETQIGRGTLSIAHAAVALATHHSGRAGGALTGKHVVVVGAGDMATTALAGLANRGADRVVVLNRSHDRGRTAASSGPLGTEVAGLDALAGQLGVADVAIVATTSPSHVITVTDVVAALSVRTTPLTLVDVGLPRNVDPAVRGLAGVRLCDLDDLRDFSEAALAGRRRAAEEAGDLVFEAVQRFEGERIARQVDPLVGSLRRWAEDVRSSELDRHARRVAELGPDGAEIVDAVTRAVIAKLLHTPTMVVKDAAGTPRGLRLVEALAELFPLDEA